MEYHEQLWVSAYKGVQTQEVKVVNWSAKSFVSMCEEWKSWNFFFFFSFFEFESWNIKPKETNNLHFLN